MIYEIVTNEIWGEDGASRNFCVQIKDDRTIEEILVANRDEHIITVMREITGVDSRGREKYTPWYRSAIAKTNIARIREVEEFKDAASEAHKS